MTESYGAIRGADFDTSDTLSTFSMSLEGRDGAGKTHFALMTCPTPIVHINFGDRDATSFLYGMEKERRDKVTLYSFQPKEIAGWTRKECSDSLKGLAEIANEHLKDGNLKGGTFILDSGSSWWEAIQEVKVAPKEEERMASGDKKMGGLIYQEGNLLVRGTIGWIKRQGAFTILTHTKKQRWDAQGPIQGVFDPQLNTRVPYLVEVRLDLRMDCVKCGSPDCSKGGHQGRVQVGRFLKCANIEYVGLELKPPTFKAVYAMQIGRAFPKEEELR